MSLVWACFFSKDVTSHGGAGAPHFLNCEKKKMGLVRKGSRLAPPNFLNFFVWIG